MVAVIVVVIVVVVVVVPQAYVTGGRSDRPGRDCGKSRNSRSCRWLAKSDSRCVRSCWSSLSNSPIVVIMRFNSSSHAPSPSRLGPAPPNPPRSPLPCEFAPPAKGAARQHLLSAGGCTVCHRFSLPCLGNGTETANMTENITANITEKFDDVLLSTNTNTNLKPEARRKQEAAFLTQTSRSLSRAQARREHQRYF